MKKKGLALMLTGALLLSCTGCGAQEAGESKVILTQEEEEAGIPTTTVEYGEVVQNVSISCNYTSTEKQDLSFPVGGKEIKYVAVKKGDYVEKGQLVAMLDGADLEENIESLEYEIAGKELQLKQALEMKELRLANAQLWYEGYSRKTQSDKDYCKEQKKAIEEEYKNVIQDMEDELDICTKRLARYHQELEEGRLIAGISGQVTYFDKEMEFFSMAAEGGWSDKVICEKDRTVMTISNLDASYFMTKELDYMEYFTPDAFYEVTYKEDGKDVVCEVVPVMPEKWEEQIYLKLTGNEIIANGTSGTITLELAHKENVLCLPNEAVHESDNGPFVYLEKDGLLEMCYITIGLKGDTTTEITGGVEQGEIIALNK